MNKQENGFSLPEQKERLETFCKFKGYEIVDYYEEVSKLEKNITYFMYVGVISNCLWIRSGRSGE